MGITDVILLAIALGLDCLIVSFSQGLIISSARIKNSLLLACVMGLFQGLMPILGYYETWKIHRYIRPYSKEIVCIIFAILGIHFLLEIIRHKKEKEDIKCIGFKCMIAMGFATSIDALVSGISLRLTMTNLFISCTIIGIISFIMSQIGFWSGNVFKNIFPKFWHVVGGVIFVILAVKSILM